jgi:hypothetical protein
MNNEGILSILKKSPNANPKSATHNPDLATLISFELSALSFQL